MMDWLKAFFNRCFGKNEGLELIAQRLRNGAPYVKAYDSNDMCIVYFKGSGEYISGWGLKRRYDVHFQDLNHIKAERDVLTNWRPVWESKYVIHHLETFTYSHFKDINHQPAENDPTEVIEWLGKMASHLKPHQYYCLANMRITNEIFAGNDIRMYSGSVERLIPREYIGNRRLVTVGELGTAFDPDKVMVADEKLIKRIHRKNTDLKRWYELKRVKSFTDKHAIRLTHRNTAHAEVVYYAMEVIIDSKAMPAHPFYVKQLLADAVEQLSKTYKGKDYHLEIDTKAIDITWGGQTVSIDTYRSNQSKFPASVDAQPILIYPDLVVLNGVNYHVSETLSTPGCLHISETWQIKERKDVEA